MDLLSSIFKKNPLKKKLGLLNEKRLKSDVISVCQAPFKSLRFEPRGLMRTCCFNKKVVIGVYPSTSILNAWNGETVNELRKKIKKQDFSYGCRICQDQLLSDELETVKILQYDKLEKTAAGFPVILDFSLHNTCNLECVMCHGEYSSSIRKNRDKLPEMPMNYDLQFVEQLKDFIPHAKQFVFAGGEPFLIEIHYPIWDAIIKLNPTANLHIVTNGTILNNRVKKILNSVNCNITISIDAIEKEIYESIRLNASFEKVMLNLIFFKEYCSAKGTQFALNVCPIVQNRFHIVDVLNFCNQQDIKVYLLYVQHPIFSTLKSLDKEQLKELELFYSDVRLENSTTIQLENNSEFEDLKKRISGWLLDKNKEKLSSKDALSVDVLLTLLKAKVDAYFEEYKTDSDKKMIYDKVELLNHRFKRRFVREAAIGEIESLSPERIVTTLKPLNEEQLIQMIEQFIE